MPPPPPRRAKSARRNHATAPWPGIHGYSCGRSPNLGAVNLEFTGILRLVYYMPKNCKSQIPQSFHCISVVSTPNPHRNGCELRELAWPGSVVAVHQLIVG